MWDIFQLFSIFIFLSNLTFSLYRPFTFLFRFIPNYFIFFHAIANRSVFMISLFICLLLVHHRVIDFFFMLTLYPPALLNVLIMYIRTGNLGDFSCIISCHLKIEIVWFLFFLCWTLQFPSFVLLIQLVLQIQCWTGVA